MAKWNFDIFLKKLGHILKNFPKPDRTQNESISKQMKDICIQIILTIWMKLASNPNSMFVDTFAWDMRRKEWRRRASSTSFWGGHRKFLGRIEERFENFQESQEILGLIESLKNLGLMISSNNEEISFIIWRKEIVGGEEMPKIT